MIKNKKTKENKGFVLLFTTILSSIILAITLSVSNLALKEIQSSITGRNTSESFFAADVGAECAIYNDKLSSTSFVNGGSGTISCGGNNITLSGGYPVWKFIISKLGSNEQGCAKVTVDKSGTSCGSPTCITSKGYNNGGNTLGICNQNETSVERQLDLSY